MKKIFINCLAATFLLLAAVSCDRQSQDLTPDFGQDNVSSAEDFLHFRTESDYDSALVNPKLAVKAPAGFVSLASVRAQAPNAKTDANDKKAPEELTRLLNKDGVMQVGNWVIKLNFEDKLVRVIANDQKKKLYTKLINEQKDKDIYVFSFEDEVFGLLNEGITESPTLTDPTGQSKPLPNGRILCSGGGIGNDEGDIRQNAHSECTSTVFSFQPNSARYVRGTDYRKFGVFFSCDAFISAWVTPETPNTTDFYYCLTNGTFQANIYWRANCNGNTGTWPSNPTLTYQYNLNFMQQIGTELFYYQEWRVYGGGRGLRCLRVTDFSLLNQGPAWNGGASNYAGDCP